MKVGYALSEESQLELGRFCDQVILVDMKENSPTYFTEFVKRHEDSQIVITSLVELGLQLIQILPALKLLKQREQIMIIIDRSVFPELTDEELFETLYQLGVKEEQIMKQRTLKGIRLAREKGMIAGRPKIQQTVVQEIEYLYSKEHRTIREIAEKCGVSVGTAYKYATKNSQ